jgi:hypothetical protein
MRCLCCIRNLLQTSRATLQELQHRGHNCCAVEQAGRSCLHRDLHPAAGLGDCHAPGPGGLGHCALRADYGAPLEVPGPPEILGHVKELLRGAVPCLTPTDSAVIRSLTSQAGWLTCWPHVGYHCSAACCLMLHAPCGMRHVSLKGRTRICFSHHWWCHMYYVLSAACLQRCACNATCCLS